MIGRPMLCFGENSEKKPFFCPPSNPKFSSASEREDSQYQKRYAKSTLNCTDKNQGKFAFFNRAKQIITRTWGLYWLMFFNCKCSFCKFNDSETMGTMLVCYNLCLSHVLRSCQGHAINLAQKIKNMTHKTKAIFWWPCDSHKCPQVLSSSDCVKRT